MEEKPPKFCVCCKQQLKQSVCFVDRAGLGRVDYPMVSEHYGKTVICYLCDGCTTEAIKNNQVETVI